MWGIPRSTKTTILCKKCKKLLEAKRTCHQVFLVCSACGVTYEINEYLDAMDDALEEFISRIPSDRT